MALPQTLSLTLLVSFMLYYLGKYAALLKRRKGAKVPPGPKGFPLLGSELEVAATNGNLMPLFNKYAEKYGPITQFKVLGETNIALSSDKIVSDMFVKRGGIYSGRSFPYAFEYIMRDLITAFMPKNDRWRRQRRLINSAMSMSTSAKYQNLMQTEAIITLNDLLESNGNHASQFLRYSYGIVARAMFGINVSSAEDKFIVDNEAYVNKAVDSFRPDKYPVNLFPMLRFFPRWMMPSLAKMDALRKVGHEMVAEVRKHVSNHIKQGIAKNSIYRDFLESRGEYAISDIEADNALYGILGGGARSVQNALLAFIYLMMEHPEWMAKLQNQVDEVVGLQRLPSWEDVPNLPMVRAVVKEMLRYRSFAAEMGLTHQLEEDDIYEGYFFAKGTIFHVNYSAILMDKEVYPDQQLFNPARWLDPSYPTYKEPLTTYPNCRGFAPFGYGRRACPGFEFAERALVIMVAQMAWVCDITRPIDPATKKPVELKIEYEPVPAPRPLPFPCDISARSAEKLAVVHGEVKRIREEDASDP